jgi:hypothetical protein
MDEYNVLVESLETLRPYTGPVVIYGILVFCLGYIVYPFIASWLTGRQIRKGECKIIEDKRQAQETIWASGDKPDLLKEIDQNERPRSGYFKH